jgi:hypothetical protein
MKTINNITYTYYTIIIVLYKKIFIFLHLLIIYSEIFELKKGNLKENKNKGFFFHACIMGR